MKSIFLVAVISIMSGNLIAKDKFNIEDFYDHAVSNDGSKIATIRLVKKSPLQLSGKNVLDAKVEIWDLKTKELIEDLGLKFSSPSKIIWNQQGTMLAVGDEFGRLKWWDGKTKKLMSLEFPPEMYPSKITALRFNNSSGTIFVGTQLGQVRFISLKNFKINTLENYNNIPVKRIDISPDGVFVIAHNKIKIAPMGFRQTEHLIAEENHGFWRDSKRYSC